MTPTNPRIAKARMGVILDAPFFGSLLMRLPMVEDETVFSNGHPTFCTNGKQIRYHPKFLDVINDQELKGVLVHEVAHCALGHLWRLGHRHLEKWNIACDYAVNNFLDTYATECREQNKPVPWELPKCGALDHALDNLSAEEIYHRLPDMGGGSGVGGSQAGGGNTSQDDGDGSDSPNFGCGQFEKPPGNNAELTEQEAEWRVATVQAATAAKAQGNCPASIKRLIDELVEAKIPWREILREFFRCSARDDYSWQRPARRYAQSGVILPGLHSERMKRFVIGVDTSGSIDAEMLKEFASECQAALDECKPEALEVIYADAAVQGVVEFTPGEAITLEMRGGGGTDFRPLFDHVEKMDEPPAAVVYLTDTMGTFPEREPDCPTLWAAYGGHINPPPFGEVVEVK